MRHCYQGTFKDQNGAVVGSSTTSDGNPGTVTVYLAGTTTLASVYTASTGGVAVNSVTTDAYGYFYFWVDDNVYGNDQLFKIVLTHPDFTTRTYDNIPVVVNSFLQSGTGAVTRTAQDKMRDLLSVKDFGAVGDGSNDDRASIGLADTAASSECTFYPPGIYKVASNLTISYPIVMAPGAMFSIPNGVTLTLNGSIDVGLRQIFSCAGTGKVVFGRLATNYVVPQWWGGVGDDSTYNDSALAGMKAASSTLDMTLYFPSGTYRFADTLSWTLNDKQAVTFKGDGIGVSKIICEGANGFVKITVPRMHDWASTPVSSDVGCVTVHDLELITTQAGGASNYCFSLYGADATTDARPAPGASFENVLMRGVSISFYWTVGIYASDLSDCEITRCHFVGSGTFLGDFINLHGTAPPGPCNHKIHQCRMIFGGTAVAITGEIQGAWITNCDFYSGNIGIIFSAVGPLLHIAHNYIESLTYAISFGSCYEVMIAHNLIYSRHISPDGWYGIAGSGGGSVTITGNTIECFADAAQTRYPIVIDNSMMTITGNVINNGSTAIWLKPGTAGAVVIGNTGTGNGTDVYDEATGNEVAHNPFS